MKALTYHGSKDVRVETVPDPQLLEDDDIVLRVTATAICGSDLHIYRGKIPAWRRATSSATSSWASSRTPAAAVTGVKRGDRVVVPFTISCGDCFFCSRSLFAACETTNPGRGAILNKKETRSGAALFGYSHLYGGVPGGQAELVRVPKANVGPLPIPDSTLSDEQVLFLSDILPTGYQAAVNAGVERGSTVAIFGAGPVGLMAAACVPSAGGRAHLHGRPPRLPPRLRGRDLRRRADQLRRRTTIRPSSSSTRTDRRGVDARSTRSASRPRAARSRPCSRR